MRSIFVSFCKWPRRSVMLGPVDLKGGTRMGFLPVYIWGCLAPLSGQCSSPEHSSGEERGAPAHIIWLILWRAAKEVVAQTTHLSAKEADWRGIGEGVLLQHLWPWVTYDSLIFESLSPVINLAYIRKNCWNLADPSIVFLGPRWVRTWV